MGKIGLGEPGPQALLRKGSEENTGVKFLSLAKEPRVERGITLLHSGTESTTGQQVPRQRQVLPPAIDPGSIIGVGLNQVQSIGQPIGSMNLNLRRIAS